LGKEIEVIEGAMTVQLRKLMYSYGNACYLLEKEEYEYWINNKSLIGIIQQ
jgi:hypothetical protein